MTAHVEKSVLPSEWNIILSDWKRSEARVTIHLRGGATLGPGEVSRLPNKALDSAELRVGHGRSEVRWTFDPTEVAAITAEATR